MNEYEQNIEVMKELRNRIDAVLETNAEGSSKIVKQPDPRKHLYISLAKSAIRIVAGVCLVSGNFVFAGAGFVLAELLGVAEELV
jgi:hypothetical protein